MKDLRAEWSSEGELSKRMDKFFKLFTDYRSHEERIHFFSSIKRRNSINHNNTINKSITD